MSGRSFPLAEGVVIDGEILQRMSEDLQRGFDRLQEEFEERMAGSEHATWRSFFHARPSASSRTARAADLIVTARPTPPSPAIRIGQSISAS